MYTYGSVSGIIHLAARRPVAAVSIVIVTLALFFAPPATLPPPAVVHVPVPPASSHTFATYACEINVRTLTNSCEATLNFVALFLQSNPSAVVVVTGNMGHTDVVRKYLVSKLGIDDPSRIKIVKGVGGAVSIERIR